MDLAKVSYEHLYYPTVLPLASQETATILTFLHSH